MIRKKDLLGAICDLSKDICSLAARVSDLEKKNVCPKAKNNEPVHKANRRGRPRKQK